MCAPGPAAASFGQPPIAPGSPWGAPVSPPSLPMLAFAFKARSKARQIERNLLASGVDLHALAGTCYRIVQDVHAAITESVATAHALKRWGAEVRTRMAPIGQAAAAALELVERTRNLLQRFTFS